MNTKNKIPETRSTKTKPTMQNLAENLWSVGKVFSTEIAVQSVNMVQNVQAWRKNRAYDSGPTLEPDEEIHKILNMYSPEELGTKGEMYLMKLRTEILDIIAQYDNDYKVQIYIHRNSHSFGTGRNCIVINITDSDITMKVKTGNSPVKEEMGGHTSVFQLANTTKNVLKKVSTLNFM